MFFFSVTEPVFKELKNTLPGVMVYIENHISPPLLLKIVFVSPWRIKFEVFFYLLSPSMILCIPFFFPILSYI